MRQDDWLDSVDIDPSVLPFHMSTWDVMEQEFKKAFIDYAKHKRASNEMCKLKMKDGNIDTFIAQFAQLAHRGGHNVNEPEVLKLFSAGLPQQLAYSCLD